MFKFGKFGLRRDLEQVAWDVAVLSGMTKEFKAALLDIDLEVAHRSQLFPRVGDLLSEIHHIYHEFIICSLV